MICKNWKEKPLLYAQHIAKTHSFIHSTNVCMCSVAPSCYFWLFAALCTIAHQAPLSMGFSRQDYWNGLPFPPPGDLPDPGIEPVSSALAGGFFTTEPTERIFYPVPCLIWGMTRCRWSILSLKDSHSEEEIDIKIIIRKQCLVACWGSHRKKGMGIWPEGLREASWGRWGSYITPDDNCFFVYLKFPCSVLVLGGQGRHQWVPALHTKSMPKCEEGRCLQGEGWKTLQLKIV